eukprot:scaffold13358_cov198-Alexandrium_tamarense.AAC.40
MAVVVNRRSESKSKKRTAVGVARQEEQPTDGAVSGVSCRVRSEPRKRLNQCALKYSISLFGDGQTLSRHPTAHR